MYEQLKRRPVLSPMEERVVLLVHTQKKRIRLRELELQAIAGATESNEKQLQDTLRELKKMMFPGPEAIDTELAARKAALAREAEKAFIVKKIDPREFMHKNSQKLQANPEAMKLAGKVMADIEREHIRDHDRRRKVQEQKKRRELKKALKQQR